MFTRKIGKLLRGKATPFNIYAAGLLGGWLAFAPGFAQAPGWILTLVAVLLVLNANIGLALLGFGLLKLLSLAIMPFTFEVGRFLLDGPTQGLFKLLANAPVLAWYGLEHYVVTGGIVLGFAGGLLFGFLISALLNAFRRKLSVLEQGSERYQVWASKGWVKLGLFLFVGGGRGKKSYEELLARKVGNPVRVAGLVLVAVVAGGAWLARGLLAEPIVTQAARSELARANGATVDLGSVQLDLAGGRVTVSDLAMADPNDLRRDIFRAATLEADVGVDDLLRRRFTVERLAIKDASSGSPREKLGELVGPPPTPTPPAEESGDEDTVTLEDVLANAEVWKERLAQAREWIERLAGEGTADDRGAPDAGPEEAPESLEERLERLVREQGWANVVADGLITDRPILTIEELVVDGLVLRQLGDEVLDVRAASLSTQPHLLKEDATIDVSSRSDRLALKLGLDADGTSPEGNALLFRMKDMPIDRIASSIVIDGQPVLSGGTFGFRIDGGWSRRRVGHLDLPMKVRLEGTTITIPGTGSAPVESLTFPLELKGPLDALRVRLDRQAFTQALVDAGAKQLANELKGELDAAVDKEREKLEKELEEKAKKELGNELEGKLKGLLGGRKDG